MSDEKPNTFVTERKWNGTATYEVRAPDKEKAKAGAKRYWKEEYGHSPSQIVAEQRSLPGSDYWYVMIADHSSGSLKGNKEYSIDY